MDVDMTLVSTPVEQLGTESAGDPKKHFICHYFLELPTGADGAVEKVSVTVIDMVDVIVVGLFHPSGRPGFESRWTRSHDGYPNEFAYMVFERVHAPVVLFHRGELGDLSHVTARCSRFEVLAESEIEEREAGLAAFQIAAQFLLKSKDSSVRGRIKTLTLLMAPAVTERILRSTLLKLLDMGAKRNEDGSALVADMEKLAPFLFSVEYIPPVEEMKTFLESCDSLPARC